MFQKHTPIEGQPSVHHRVRTVFQHRLVRQGMTQDPMPAETVSDTHCSHCLMKPYSEGDIDTVESLSVTFSRPQLAAFLIAGVYHTISHHHELS